MWLLSTVGQINRKRKQHSCLHNIWSMCLSIRVVGGSEVKKDEAGEKGWAKFL